MSGLELLIPMVFSAVSGAAAAVSSVAMSAGAAIFGAGAMSGVVGSVLTGAIGHGLVGGVIGGAISAISGGDFMDGFSSGAISGGIMGGVGGSGILGDIMGTSSAASAADSILEPVVSTPMNASMSSLMEGTGMGGIGGGTIPSVVNPVDSAFGGFGSPASQGAANASVGGAASNGAAGAIDFVQSTPSPVLDKMAGGGGGGAFDGFFSDREVLGGAISGVGKVLSGDTAQAAAKANNQGAMDRQMQAQQNTAGNYDISTGLMPDGSVSDPGAGRPTPTQQFGANQQGQSGAWEYYFDPATKTIKRRAMSMA